MTGQRIDWSRVADFLATPVSLHSMELLVLEVPQHETFVSAIGKRQSRQALIVKWTDKNGVSGYGECGCRPDPYYSHEFLTAAIEVISHFIYPAIKKARTYGEVLSAMQPIRGWQFTRAAVEFAMNDAIRRATGKGIIEHCGLQQADRVPVGISLGMFGTVTALEEKLAAIECLGYKRLKFKIAPTYTDEAVINALTSLTHPYVAFDANGSFSEDTFVQLAPFAATGSVIEQPFAPGYVHLVESFAKQYTSLALCLDEEIAHSGHLQQYLSLMAELNLKPGRVGGLYASLQLIDMTRQFNLPVWIGGMFETGIGRTQNLQLAALLPEAKAHDLSPSSRYFKRDVLQEPVTMQDGWVSASAFANPQVDARALQELGTHKTVLNT